MDKISKDHAQWIWDHLGPSMRLLRAIYLRLERRGYQDDDKLFRAAKEAWHAIHGLSVTAHYAAVEKGVGDSPEKRDSSGTELGKDAPNQHA